MIFSSEPRITQYFAENPDFYKSFGLFGHEGIDLVPTNVDNQVFAFLSGYVTRKYLSRDYGLTVMIHSPALKITYRYAHLSECFVDEGDNIATSQKVGIMGHTPVGRVGIDGQPMRDHLHISVIPEVVVGVKDFPNNGFKGRVDPLGMLRILGEL